MERRRMDSLSLDPGSAAAVRVAVVVPVSRCFTSEPWPFIVTVAAVVDQRGLRDRPAAMCLTAPALERRAAALLDGVAVTREAIAARGATFCCGANARGATFCCGANARGTTFCCRAKTRAARCFAVG